MRLSDNRVTRVNVLTLTVAVVSGVTDGVLSMTRVTLTTSQTRWGEQGPETATTTPAPTRLLPSPRISLCPGTPLVIHRVWCGVRGLSVRDWVL